MTREPQALFGAVVALMGLSSVLAPDLLTQILAEHGRDAQTATRDDYFEVLDALEQRLAVYMPVLSARARCRRIAEMLRSDGA